MKLFNQKQQSKQTTGRSLKSLNSIVYGNENLWDTLLHMSDVVIGLLETYVVSGLNVEF